MKIETKYDVGQKLYFINFDNGKYKVELCEVKQITYASKYSQSYKIDNRWSGRSVRESELFEEFEDALKQAIEKQKSHNEDVLNSLKEQKQPTKLFN